jgi:ABC-type polysaccharide/polyol phosphate transport system ATPase subunit
MSNIAIKVEGLGKKYIIGHQGKGGYKTFREQIGDGFKTVFSKTKKMLSGQIVVEGDEMEDFWALKEISFNVKQGETLGIIGRNGAGKSTLLKILSRITEPTTGKVILKGRVASLLEVGTGFHPELSGRENIFLNGAILGMSQAEIKRKFDEIVDFSGVEKFLDTPVKRYSSGMYVRLAFSVAAHLEPEILVVDEVLAVGDAEFQKKCLGKMQDVSRNDGRTVLFVSHQMGSIAQLCNNCLLLKQGRIEATGVPLVVIDKYYNQLQNDSYSGRVTKMWIFLSRNYILVMPMVSKKIISLILIIFIFELKLVSTGLIPFKISALALLTRDKKKSFYS